MPPTYSSTHATVKPAKLTKEALLAIGKLVRACAELEDLVTLYICGLAQVNASRATVLLGKTAIRRRVEMAEYLAKMTGPEITHIHKEIFGTDFWDTFRCRNAVAHGVLMGRMGPDENRRWAFLTSKTEPPMNDSAIQVVEGYSTRDIQIYANWAETVIPQIEGHLKLETLRGERLARPLGPHRNAHPPREKDGSPAPQPQSSRESARQAKLDRKAAQRSDPKNRKKKD